MQLTLHNTYARLSGLHQDDINRIVPLLTGYFKESTIQSVQKKCQSFPLTTINDEGHAKLCRVIGDSIEFPQGLLTRVLSRLQFTNVSLPEGSLTPKDVSLEGLWDHQKELYQAALTGKRCCVQSPTGSGKSLVLFKLVETLKDEPILFLTFKKDLMFQLREKLEEHLQEPVGMVGGGEYHWARVTIGTIQTLTSRRDKFHLDNLAAVKSLLVDEVHNIATGSGALLSERLVNTEYRIGVSATVFRNKESKLLIEGLMGPLAHVVQVEEMTSSEVIMQPRVQFFEVPQIPIAPRLLNLSYSHSLYSKLYRALIVTNKKRNQMAAAIAKRRFEETGYPVVIIVNHVGTSQKKSISHSDLIEEECARIGFHLPIIHGGTPKDEVHAVLSQMTLQKIPGCIAGPKIMSEGIDIPPIGTIVIMAAGSSSIDLVQRIGRTVRKMSGKCEPVVVDFYDQQWLFKSQSRKRMEKAEHYFNANIEIIPLKKLHEYT